MTDPLYNPEPFAQIPGQTAFDWNTAPDTRDTRRRAECHDCGAAIPTLGYRCAPCQETASRPTIIAGRWDPFQ